MDCWTKANQNAPLLQWGNNKSLRETSFQHKNISRGESKKGLSKVKKHLDLFFASPLDMKIR